MMPGGSGANVAVWLARAGAAVTFAGRVGDDLFGRWLADDLRREGVVPALVVDREHGTAVIQVLVEPGGERTMVPDRGANAHWSEADVVEGLVAGAELLHVVGYVLFDDGSRGGALQAMETARAHGVPISFDPSSHGPLQRLGAAGFWSLVGDISILLPNRAEAGALTGQNEMEKALELLQAHAPVVAIKLDSEGCLAAAGKQRRRQPAPLTVVANTTGAGDAFDAAFLARWLTTRDLAAACQAGVTLGSHAASLPTTR